MMTNHTDSTARLAGVLAEANELAEGDAVDAYVMLSAAVAEFLRGEGVPVAPEPTDEAPTTGYVVEDLQACEPESLAPRSGITVMLEAKDSQGFDRVDVYGPDPRAIIDYVRDHWGDDEATGDWFSEYVVARVHHVGDDPDSPEHPEIAPTTYRCTVVIDMPADDGDALTPAEVVEFLTDHGASLVEWHDEDLLTRDDA